MSEEKSKRNKIFALEEIFPDSEELFTASFKKLDSSYKEALIVFDTNVLFLPYSMATKGIEILRELYGRLKSNKQLFIPRRVAREFVRNRNGKLAEIHYSVLKGKSGKTKINLNYPILESLEEKAELDEAFSELGDAEKKYFDMIDKLASKISSWEWDDPVSSMYSELFTADMLIDHSKSDEALVKELSFRTTLKIPPGYKDSGKDDGGVGDLVIWLSLLELGESKNRDVIFVTEDAKADWWNQSNGAKFLPRYELIDEFRRASKGGTLHIIELSKLLKLFEVNDDFIEEAKIAEEEQKEKMAHNKELLKILRGDKCDAPAGWLEVLNRSGAMKDKESFLKKREDMELYRRNLFELKGKPSLEEADELFKDLSFYSFKDLSSREARIAQIVITWFLSKFEDPSNCCPFKPDGGGYQYLWGGPYDAMERVESEFSGVFSRRILDAAVSNLNKICSEWSAVPDCDS